MANTYDITQKLQAIADAIENGGGGGGGGTTVIANPTGTPTADLDTVQIGQVIYDIPGSGGGGGSAYREDIIFTGSNSNTSPITLSADINYYDLLQFIVAYVDHKVTETFEIPVAYFVNNYTYSTFTDIHITDNISLTLAGNEWFRIARGQIDTQLQFMKGSNFYLKSVVGIKLPRGAGSDEAVDINYNNTTSGLTAINVQDAIDEIDTSVDTLNSKIAHTDYVGVTVNSGQTYRKVFDALYALADTTKINANSYVTQTISGGFVSVFKMATFSPSQFNFMWNTNSTYALSRRIVLQASNSVYSEASGGSTTSDKSTTSATVGDVFELHY